MDNPENSLILASTRQLSVFELNVWAKESKEQALAQAALIGKVSDGDAKIIAVRAQVALKQMINAIEKARKELKEPILQAGRRLDTLCANESLELEKEFGRVSQAVSEFDLQERRRIDEEKRLQREELERIEGEKQAELKRIADEQAAKEAETRRIQDEAARKVKEAKEAAERLVSEAKTKKDREAAEKARLEADKAADAARIERERQDTLLQQQAAQATANAARIEEQAGDAAYCAAKPIEILKVKEQHTTVDWEITKLNEWQLAKARPDLVRKIEFDLRAVKEELKRGVKLPGVEGKEVYKASVKAKPLQTQIEI